MVERNLMDRTIVIQRVSEQVASDDGFRRVHHGESALCGAEFVQFAGQLASMPSLLCGVLMAMCCCKHKHLHDAAPLAVQDLDVVMLQATILQQANERVDGEFSQANPSHTPVH